MEAVLGKIQTLVKGQLGGLKSKVKAEGQRKVQKVIYNLVQKIIL